MEEAWTKFQDIYNQLPVQFRKNFQVVQASEGGRFHVGMRRFDEKMYIIHYMYSLRAQDTPSYVIEGSDKALFKIYLNDFELLLKRFCKPDDLSLHKMG